MAHDTRQGTGDPAGRRGRRMPHRVARRVAWAACCAGLVAPLLSGCATYLNPATGRAESLLITTPAEVAWGQMANSQLQAQLAHGPPPAPALVGRVETIGRRIADVADRRDVQYRFHVIPDDQLNAFTILGGDVYVYRGLVERASDEELACVLGHEVGHVVARHGAKALQARLGYTLLMQAAFRGRAEMVAHVLDTAFTLVANGFSRQDELQADLLAVRYAARAGFDPHGMITFLKALQAEQGEGSLAAATVYLRTHPLYRDRIAQAEAEIARLRVAPQGRPR